MQKEQAGATKRAARATPAESLRQSLDKTRGKLEKTDAANWSEDDRLAVNDSMTQLRDAMETFFNPSREGGDLA